MADGCGASAIIYVNVYNICVRCARWWWCCRRRRRRKTPAARVSSSVYILEFIVRSFLRLVCFRVRLSRSASLCAVHLSLLSYTWAQHAAYALRATSICARARQCIVARSLASRNPFLVGNRNGRLQRAHRVFAYGSAIRLIVRLISVKKKYNSRDTLDIHFRVGLNLPQLYDWWIVN